MLGPDAKKILRKASKEKLQASLERLGRHFRRDDWIGKTNRYRKNCVSVIKRDESDTRPFRNGDFAQYIAASGPLHCADGWGFLGRATQCHSIGDADSARHLGYYAELRAAMSLLAYNGVGILDRTHYVIDSKGTCQKVRARSGKYSGTHSFTWLALQHWAGLRNAADLLGQVITPGGLPLRDWFNAFRGGSSLQPIATKWLSLWGLDLKQFVDDRDARNEASYRPNRLSTKRGLDALSASTFLRDVWMSLDPSMPSRFELIDRQLLRLALEDAFKAITDREAKHEPDKFEQRVAKMLDTVVLDAGIRNRWKGFLTRGTEADTLAIILTAREDDPIDDPQHHIQVLSRATLLLRVAIGAWAISMRTGRYESDDLKFWWRPLGEERGLWEPGHEPLQLTDLWADIQSALDDMKSWEERNRGNNPSYHKWREEQNKNLDTLGGFERVAIWGLGI
jgi:hypothetical protein